MHRTRWSRSTQMASMTARLTAGPLPIANPNPNPVPIRATHLTDQAVQYRQHPVQYRQHFRFSSSNYGPLVVFPVHLGGRLGLSYESVETLPMPRLGDVVAAAVRAERARLRLTQQQLAERLGWSANTVADLETGRRRAQVDDLPAICEALGIRFATLIDRAEPDDLRRLDL